MIVGADALFFKLLIPFQSGDCDRDSGKCNTGGTRRYGLMLCDQ